MSRQKRRDLPDESAIAVRPSAWLHWYEQNLRSVLRQVSRQRRVEREDVELLLLDRSDLERTLRALPKALSPAERRKLAKLDEELKKLAPVIVATLPDLPEIRRSLEVPRSHWWWFLDERESE